MQQVYQFSCELLPQRVLKLCEYIDHQSQILGFNVPLTLQPHMVTGDLDFYIAGTILAIFAMELPGERNANKTCT